MLSYEQTKAIENALGVDKAGPVIQALETVEERTRAEVVTTTQLDVRVAEIKGYVDTRLAESRAEIIKWVAGMLVAQAALIATLVKLL